MPLAWPGLFLSLGWNFLEFSFAPPGGGFAWGWLVCGVVFVLMGGLPLLLAFKSVREKIKSRLRSGRAWGLTRCSGCWLPPGSIWASFFFAALPLELRRRSNEVGKDRLACGKSLPGQYRPGDPKKS